uniref:Uncharacterized protein n=1 Tax=Panagrolaimus superbus TaxID=310955 RepID=A0A914Z978_9BILA
MVERASELGESESDDDSPASKKRRIKENDVENDVEMAITVIAAEPDVMQMDINAFREIIKESMNTGFKDIIAKLNQQNIVCPADSDPDQLFPWDDISGWPRQNDRILKEAFGSEFKVPKSWKSWLQVLQNENDESNPKFRCKFCYEHIQANKDLFKDGQFGRLSSENGAEYPQNSVETKKLYWSKKLREHETPRLRRSKLCNR